MNCFPDAVIVEKSNSTPSETAPVLSHIEVVSVTSLKKKNACTTIPDPLVVKVGGKEPALAPGGTSE